MSAKQPHTRLAAHPVTHEDQAWLQPKYGGVGIGIGVAVAIAIGGHFDTDPDCDPDTDSDAELSR